MDVKIGVVWAGCGDNEAEEGPWVKGVDAFNSKTFVPIELKCKTGIIHQIISIFCENL